MKAGTAKQNRINNTPKDEESDNSPIRKWLSSLTPKKKAIIIGGSVTLFLLIIALIPSMTFRNKMKDCDVTLDFFCELGAPVANTNDFKGKTIKEAKELSDERGIKYEIDDEDIYDPDSEDTQTVDEIDGVYDLEGNFVPEFNNYRRSGLSLYKGWSIKISVNKTEKQLNDEKECNAREGYTYDYQNGKVDCRKTQETVCKEQGKIYYDFKCYNTQGEVDEAKRKAEENRKAYELKREQEEAEKKAKEEEQTQPATNSSTTYSSGASSTDELEPGEVKSLCNRTMKSLGLPEIKTVTNGYPMGYPEEIFVLVGTTKDGRQVQCQINWQNWTVKSIRLNGALVYGE